MGDGWETLLTAGLQLSGGLWKVFGVDVDALAAKHISV